MDEFHAYAVVYADGSDERVGTLDDARERVKAAKSLPVASQLFPAMIFHFGTPATGIGTPVEEHRLQDD